MMIYRIFFSFFIMFASMAAQAAPPILSGLAVYEDKLGTETIETISGFDQSRFKNLKSQSFTGGFTRSAHWLKLTVDAPAGESWLEVLPPILDDLRLYVPNPSLPSAYIEHRQGDTLPFAAHEVDYRGFVFKFNFPEAGRYTLYLRLQTTSTSMLILRVWSPDGLLATATIEYGIIFTSIAIVLVALLLNINTWIYLRDRLISWYLIYLSLLSILFAGFTGLLHQYIFNKSGYTNNLVLDLAVIAFIAVGNIFHSQLFMVDRNQPWLFWIYKISVGIPLLGILTSISGYHVETMKIMVPMVLAMTLLGFVLSIRLLLRSISGGLMVHVSNLLLMIGLSILILFLQGVITDRSLMLHILPIIMLGIFVTLQLAVGARYRSLREDRIRAENNAQHERVVREQQGQFLAMLAHELRTSLAVLKLSFFQQPMAPKAIAIAERAMTGMADIIDRSIKVEKLADGQLLLESLPCDVVELIEAEIADCLAPDRFQLRTEIRPTLYTDAKLLRVIIRNLIDNAAKYAAPNTPIDLVVTEAKGFNFRIENAVGPSGTPDAEKVFDKYYRAPQAHKLTGSGLGLYLAQGIALKLGGKLSYQPSADRVAFSLNLPATLPENSLKAFASIA
jgi:signal transduction histidine kinase